MIGKHWVSGKSNAYIKQALSTAAYWNIVENWHFFLDLCFLFIKMHKGWMSSFLFIFIIKNHRQADQQQQNLHEQQI